MVLVVAALKLPRELMFIAIPIVIIGFVVQMIGAWNIRPSKHLPRW